MGRLIDVDAVKKRFPIMENDFGMVINDRLHRELDKIPTVEAISKAEYEARLKADLKAILVELQLELDEMKITKVRSAGFAPYSKDPFRRGVNCSKEVIQQKINALKEN